MMPGAERQETMVEADCGHVTIFISINNHLPTLLTQSTVSTVIAIQMEL